MNNNNPDAVMNNFKNKVVLTQPGLRTNDEILSKDKKSIIDSGYFSDVVITTADKKPLSDTHPKYEALNKLGNDNDYNDAKGEVYV